MDDSKSQLTVGMAVNSLLCVVFWRFLAHFGALWPRLSGFEFEGGETAVSKAIGKVIEVSHIDSN
jgi:hypothetical protein